MKKKDYVEYFTLNREAEILMSDFYDRIESYQSCVEEKEFNELVHDIREHFHYAIQQKLAGKDTTVADAQVVMETICEFGDLDQVFASLTEGEPDSEVPKGKEMRKASSVYTFRKRLACSNTNRVIAGVCGGLGEYFRIEAVLIRIAFILFLLMGGSSILIYLVLWVIIPREKPLQMATDEETARKMAEAQQPSALMQVFLFLVLLFILYLPLACCGLFAVAKGAFNLLKYSLFESATLFNHFTGLPGALFHGAWLVIGLACLALLIQVFSSIHLKRYPFRRKSIWLFLAAIIVPLMLIGSLYGYYHHCNSSEITVTERLVISPEAGQDRGIISFTPRNQKRYAQRREVEIVGDVNENQIVLVTVKNVSGKDRQQAQNLAEALEVSADFQGNTLTVGETMTRNMSVYRDMNIKYKVMVPPGFSVKVDEDSTDVSVYGLMENVAVGSKRGSINLYKLEGATVQVSNNLGSIQAKEIQCSSLVCDLKMGSFKGEDIRAETYTVTNKNGSVSLRNVTGDGDLEPKMGSVNASGISGNLRASTKMGSVKVDIDRYAEDGRVDCSSKMGQIELHLPPLPVPHLVIDTDVGIGEVENDFKLDRPGAQAPVVHVTTRLGSIAVKKK